MNDTRTPNCDLLEVSLSSPDDFLKIKETLKRIGIPSIKSKTLWQSCHILHKQGHYYILHFKELFKLDGKESELSTEDLQRTRLIAKMLVQWNLCKPVNFDPDKLDVGNILSKTKIIKHSDIDGWDLRSKHSLGRDNDD